jgi:hypothetical protein
VVRITIGRRLRLPKSLSGFFSKCSPVTVPPSVVSFLLSSGGKHSLADTQEQTALRHAAKQNLYAVVQVLRRQRVLQVWRNSPDAGGHTNHPTRDPERPTVLWAMESSLGPSSPLKGITNLLAANPNTSNTPSPAKPTTTSSQPPNHAPCDTPPPPRLQTVHPPSYQPLPSLYTSTPRQPLNNPVYIGRSVRARTPLSQADQTVRVVRFCQGQGGLHGQAAFYAACAGGHVAATVGLLEGGADSGGRAGEGVVW